MDGEANSDPLDGFGGLAEVLASDKEDSRYQQYCCFTELFTRNLVHLQSAVAVLRARQAQLDEDDKLDRNIRTLFRTREWEKLAAEDGTDPKSTERMEVAKKLEDRLSAYGSALLLQFELLALPRATARQSQDLRDAFARTKLKTPTGASDDLYDDFTDTVFLGRKPDDPLSSLIRDYCPCRWLGAQKPDQYTGTPYLSVQKSRWLAMTVYTVLAVFLLYGPVVLFHFVKEPRAVMILVGVCVSVATGILRLSVPMSASEMFALCVLYTLVLVVVIGSLHQEPKST